MTHRCARRTTCPDSSSRKSRRVMRRAVGDRPCRPSPITNRWSPACATIASRCPSGLQCALATPYFSFVSCHGSPPSSGRIQTWATRLVVARPASGRRRLDGRRARWPAIRRERGRGSAGAPDRRETVASRGATRTRPEPRGAGRRRSTRRQARCGTTRARPGLAPGPWGSHRSCGGVCNESAGKRESLTAIRGICHPRPGL